VKETSVKMAAEADDTGDEDMDDDEDDGMDHPPTEEELKEEMLRAQIKQAEADKIQMYQEKLHSETLKTFEDIPDPVNTIRVFQSFEDAVQIEWNMPCGNNRQILNYKVYLSTTEDNKNFDEIGQVAPNSSEGGI
jgi:hypothetical protein